MKVSDAQYLAERIVHFYLNAADMNKKMTVDHFVAEGYNKNSTYAVIRRYEAKGTTKFEAKPGRPSKVMTPRKTKKILKKFENTPSLSVRNCAKSLNLSPSTVSKIKVNRLGIRARVKQKAPKYVKDQETRAKVACARIYRKFLTKKHGLVVIMDDETYVPVDPSDVPGRKFYHVGCQYKIKEAEKFK